MGLGLNYSRVLNWDSATLEVSFTSFSFLNLPSTEEPLAKLIKKTVSDGDKYVLSEYTVDVKKINRKHIQSSYHVRSYYDKLSAWTQLEY